MSNVSSKNSATNSVAQPAEDGMHGGLAIAVICFGLAPFTAGTSLLVLFLITLTHLVTGVGSKS